MQMERIINLNPECLVNPINCDGTPESYLHKQLAKHFDDNNRTVANAAKDKSLKISKPLLIFRIGGNPRYIINICVKRNKEDEYDAIALLNLDISLDGLFADIKKYKIKEFYMPQIGTNEEWAKLKDIVIQKWLFYVRDGVPCRMYLLS